MLVMHVEHIQLLFRKLNDLDKGPVPAVLGVSQNYGLCSKRLWAMFKETGGKGFDKRFQGAAGVCQKVKFRS